MHHRRSDKVLDLRIHFLKLQNLWKVCHHCDPWHQLEFVTRYSANVLAVKIQWRHVYEKLPFPLLMRNTLPTCIFAFMLCITKSGITPWAECKTKRKYLFCLTQLINLLYLLTSQDLRLESKPAFVCLNIRPTSNNRSRELLLFQNDAKMHKCPQKSTAGRALFETFPKNHPFWRAQASLRGSSSLAKSCTRVLWWLWIICINCFLFWYQNFP